MLLPESYDGGYISFVLLKRIQVGKKKVIKHIDMKQM